MSETVNCPALFIASPGSGEGKTTLTAALARYFKNQGMQVRIFKVGADYPDTQILTQACGHPVIQLDLWLGGEIFCQQQLYKAACEADLILIEGSLGLFDGKPSSADLAIRFGLPVTVIMNVAGITETAAVLVEGMAASKADLTIKGLVANCCIDEEQANLICESLPDEIPLVAALLSDEMIVMSERHLGFIQTKEAEEILENRLEQAVNWIVSGINNAALLQLPPEITFENVEPVTIEPLLEGKVIAIARDKAFSFIYESNLQLLKALGAKYCFFSPLHDIRLPDADAIWLPGGNPEIHARQLSANISMQHRLADFHQSGRPMLAEGGGLLYCLQTLTDLNGNAHFMTKILSGQGMMQERRRRQDMQVVTLPEGDIRGHAFYHSSVNYAPSVFTYAVRNYKQLQGEPFYRDKGLTASCLHLFFASNPAAVAALFTAGY